MLTKYIPDSRCPTGANAKPRNEHWEVYGLGGKWQGWAADEDDALRRAGDGGILIVSCTNRLKADQAQLAARDTAMAPPRCERSARPEKN